MTARPGANLLAAAVVLASLSAGVFLWTPMAWLLGVAALGVLAASVHDALAARRGLASVVVTREAPAVVGRDLPLAIRYTIRNRSTRRLVGRVRDIRPHEAIPNYVWRDFRVAAHDELEIVETLRLPVRGAYGLGPIWVRVAGPWGLVELHRPVESSATIRVLPETFASREELVKDVGAEIRLLERIRAARQTGDGTEFDSLYPYQYGDDPRRIDWRATARARQPIVRHYQVERHRDVMLVVDCGRLMAGDAGRGTKLDRAVDSALHLAGVALRGGDRCGVGLFDDRVRGYLPPVAGAPSLRAVVESLYAARSEWRESDFTRMFAELQVRQAKRSLVVILSDLSDEETSASLRTSLLRLTRRHLVLFAALRTPLLEQMVTGPTESLEQGAQKAVAMRLARERRQSLHALERGGVHVLDVEPRQLTLPLINRFITLRTGRLM